MLHDRKGDEELERSIDAIRVQLQKAKVRVAVLYPRARICWVLETREWVVMNVMTRERIEASRSLDELGTRAPKDARGPESATYRRTEEE
jgi:hypothetical protein